MQPISDGHVRCLATRTRPLRLLSLKSFMLEILTDVRFLSPPPAATTNRQNPHFTLRTASKNTSVCTTTRNQEDGKTSCCSISKVSSKNENVWCDVSRKFRIRNVLKLNILIM